MKTRLVVSRQCRQGLLRTYATWARWRTAPPQRWAHGFAVVFAIALIATSLFSSLAKRGGASGDSTTSVQGVLVLAVLVAFASIGYSSYYFPPLTCAMLLAGSLGGDGTEDVQRYRTLVPGLVAGVVYLILSLWWRRHAVRLRRAISEAEYGEYRASIFEIGRRYLAAWLLLAILGVANEIWPGTSLTASNEVVQDAGTIVILVDLLALLPGRFLLVRSVLHPARPKPYPRLFERRTRQPSASAEVGVQVRQQPNARGSSTQT